MKLKKSILIIPCLLCLLLIGTGVAYFVLQPTPGRISVFFVSAPDDDARTFLAERSDVGYGNEDGQWALLQLSPSYSFGLRFRNISIPRYAEIKEAYVKLYSIGTPRSNRPNCLIYGDKINNSYNFTTYGVFERCGRNYTQAVVDWNESVAFSVWVETPNLQSIIQEIVTNETWEENNSLSLLFITKGIPGYSATFQNVESGYASALLVKWIDPRT